MIYTGSNGFIRMSCYHSVPSASSGRTLDVYSTLCSIFDSIINLVNIFQAHARVGGGIIFIKILQNQQERVEVHVHQTLRHQALELIIVLPGPLLLWRGIMNAFCPSQRLDIEIGDPGTIDTDLVVEWNADFMFVVEHHIVLPQAPLAVVDAQHSLLHLHLFWSGTPGERVVLSPLRTLARERSRKGNAVLRMSQTFLLRLADCTTAGDMVTTPDVLTGDTSGMC
jgi:hypothetical protein